MMAGQFYVWERWFKMPNGITPWDFEEELTSDRMNLMVGEANQIDTSTKNSLEAHKADTNNPHPIYAKKESGNWIDAQLINGWTGFIQYKKNDLGLVSMRGRVTPGGITGNTVVCILPTGYRPLMYKTVPAVDLNSGVNLLAFYILTELQVSFNQVLTVEKTVEFTINYTAQED